MTAKRFRTAISDFNATDSSLANRCEKESQIDNACKKNLGTYHGLIPLISVRLCARSRMSIWKILYSIMMHSCFPQALLLPRCGSRCSPPHPSSCQVHGNDDGWNNRCKSFQKCIGRDSYHQAKHSLTTRCLSAHRKS